MQRQPSVLGEDAAPPGENARVLHQLMGEIEVIRLARQREYRDHPHPQLKHFTQQELNDEACPTYKNWLVGRSHRLPSRSMLLRIAEYLECSSSQRADLLLAAQYVPEYPDREDGQFQQALEHARRVLLTLPYPAIVVTHTFQIEAANQFFQHLFELPDLLTFPTDQRNMFQLHFSQNLSIRARSTSTTQAHEAWQKHGLYGIQLFKQINALYRYDRWYRQLIEQWCEIADFRVLWERENNTHCQENAPSQVFLARLTTTDELLPIRFQHMLVSVSSKIYPAISALLPADEAAHRVFAALGSSFP
jgi:hypothetical protein